MTPATFSAYCDAAEMEKNQQPTGMAGIKVRIEQEN
jgi:hypothetical protein